jgi:hypothetical protein
MLTVAAELLVRYRCFALLYVLFPIQQNSMLLKSNIICKSRCKHLVIQHLRLFPFTTHFPQFSKNTILS